MANLGVVKRTPKNDKKLIFDTRRRPFLHPTAMPCFFLGKRERTFQRTDVERRTPQKKAGRKQPARLNQYTRPNLTPKSFHSSGSPIPHPHFPQRRPSVAIRSSQFAIFKLINSVLDPQFASADAIEPSNSALSSGFVIKASAPAATAFSL